MLYTHSYPYLSPCVIWPFVRLPYQTLKTASSHSEEEEGAVGPRSSLEGGGLPVFTTAGGCFHHPRSLSPQELLQERIQDAPGAPATAPWAPGPKRALSPALPTHS